MKKILLFTCLAFAVMGCNNNAAQPDLNADQKQQASQLDVIAKKSGGDWEKLSDEDKKTMINIGGSEQGAKMLLLGKVGKVGNRAGGTPGGPPPGGPPKGGPPAGGG